MYSKTRKYSCLFTALILLVAISGCQKEPQMTKTEYIRYVVEQVRSDSLESYVSWLEGMGTRFALADNHREVAVQIRKRFMEAGYPAARLDSFYLTRTFREITYSTWQYNVTATLSGREDDSITVVGAHYDSYSADSDPFTVAPGANDNATGVAAVLEIARVTRENGFTPKYPIRYVAFAAEELGLHGSSYQAAREAAAGNRVMMMINYDMIAYLADPSMSPWHVNIIHYDNSTLLKNEAAVLCAANSTLVSYSDNTNYNRSDSYAFFMNGFRALFYHQSDIESTYHTAGDGISVCNFDYSREIVKASFALIIDKNY